MRETKKIYLCRPNRQLICVLNGIETDSVEYSKHVKDFDQLSFVVDKFIVINGEQIMSQGYDELDIGMYLYLQDIGFFRMEYPAINNDGNKQTKQITAYSIQKEVFNVDWVGLKINTAEEDSQEMIVVGSQASGYVTFTGVSGTIIPAGTRVDDGSHYYSTTAEVIIPDKSTTVNVDIVSEDVGQKYNIEAGAINHYPGIKGLTKVTNPAAIAGGADTNVTKYGTPIDLISFYNPYDPRLSLIDIIMTKIPIWQVGYMDPYVFLKYDDHGNPVVKMQKSQDGKDVPQFREITKPRWDIDENGHFYINSDIVGQQEPVHQLQSVGIYQEDNISIYAFLTSTLGPKLNCLFFFDTINRVIHVISKRRMIENDQNFYDTGVYISFRNLANTVDIAVDEDSVITRLNCQGQNELDFMDLNYGSSRLIDMSYFANEPWMEEGLSTKIKNWQKWVEDNRAKYKEYSVEQANVLRDMSDITYKVPSDDNYWKQWDDANEELLTKSLAYYKAKIALLQSSVDQNPVYDEDGDYVAYNNGKTDEYYLNLLYDMKNGYGGYGTYYQIVNYIIPNINIAIENLDKTVDNKLDYIDERDYDWSLYGIEELTTQIKNIQNKYNILYKQYGKNWDKDPLDEQADAAWGAEHFNAQHQIYLQLKLQIGDACKYNGESVKTFEDLKGLTPSFGQVYLVEDQSMYYAYDGNKNNEKPKTIDQYGWYKMGMLACPKKEGFSYAYLYLDHLYELRDGTDRNGNVSANYDSSMAAKLAEINKKMLPYKKMYELASAYTKQDGTLPSTEEELNEAYATSNQNKLFTEEQLAGVYPLLIDTDYQNTNIGIQTTDDVVSKIDVEQQLLDDSLQKMSELCRPQIKFATSLDNLYRLKEFEKMATSVELLNYIYLEVNKNEVEKVRIVGITYDPCQIDENLQLEFSNMITSRSGRSDFTDILQTQNNRGQKNSITVNSTNGNLSGAGESTEYLTNIIQAIAATGLFKKAVKNTVTNPVRGVQQIVDAVDTETFNNAMASLGNMSDSVVKQVSDNLTSGDYVLAGGAVVGAIAANYIAVSAISSSNWQAKNGDYKQTTQGMYINMLNGELYTSKFHIDQNGDIYMGNGDIHNADIMESTFGNQDKSFLIDADGNITLPKRSVLTNNGSEDITNTYTLNGINGTTYIGTFVTTPDISNKIMLGWSDDNSAPYVVVDGQTHSLAFNEADVPTISDTELEEMWNSIT